jgi:hypothetical protein
VLNYELGEPSTTHVWNLYRKQPPESNKQVCPILVNRPFSSIISP